MASSSEEVPEFLRLAAHPLRWRLLAGLAGGDLRVRELMALVGEPQNLVSYHLRLLREGGLVAAHRSSFDGRDSYYRLDLDRCAQALAGVGAALHPSLRFDAVPPSDRPGPVVLFVCTGNSARSPIAEALLRHRSGGRLTVASAGSRPRPEMHPHAARLLREQYGIELAGQRPRSLDSLRGRRFDFVITLCDKAREVRPRFGEPSRRVHWSVPEPAATYAALHLTAADIDARVRHLLPVLAQAQEDQP